MQSLQRLVLTAKPRHKHKLYIERPSHVEVTMQNEKLKTLTALFSVTAQFSVTMQIWKKHMGWYIPVTLQLVMASVTMCWNACALPHSGGRVPLR